ncbi:flavodoxin [Lactobacillus amylovorus]|uniref:flavodoxin n=1 Tax=Lactobacillus amylovorus TaxID=1604 RepID=UPI003A5D07A4
MPSKYKKKTSVDLDCHNDTSRANEEQSDKKSRPASKPLKIYDFDTLILGYPTWWGSAPRIIDSLVESLNLKGKTILPFITSCLSTPERGVEELKQWLKCNNIT